MNKFLPGWRENPPSSETISQVQNGIASLGYSCFVACSIPHDSLAAPRNFSSQLKENRSLLLREYIHYLGWQPPATRTAVSYRIYEIKGGDRSLLDEIPASAKSYLRHFVDPNKKYIYAILAIDREGKEGNPALTSASFESPVDFQGAPFCSKTFFWGIW